MSTGIASLAGYKTTASSREFESTAIDKLVTKGVPLNIARVFVHHGLPKSGRLDMIKDAVCKMQYERFFVPVSAEDHKDPFRVGTLVPHTVKSTATKFHTVFAMSDLDAAKFINCFPEFEVIARGSVSNPHAFYANKRYAETELLVSMVFKHARENSLDAHSLIDLGGNYTWHQKRNRAWVHCDNPILSARDAMRYKVREVFSGEDPSTSCRKTFQDCAHSANYAIAVHSTYDVTPKQLAMAMLKKNVKTFFGVMNYIPGIETKAMGEYVSDGMVMRLSRQPRQEVKVKYTFVHDPSLEYEHSLNTLRKYLFMKTQYVVWHPQHGRKTFTYEIMSVRGSSIVFKLYEARTDSTLSTALWTPPSSRLYLLSLSFLGVDRLEVDSEFFDRLVLMAAGARNVEQYDIIGLYRYAKSLRQRVSINGVVLSSGYSNNSEQLVDIVVAAYAVAASYRVESNHFFQRATSQIVALRGTSFFRDVFTLTGKAILTAALALPLLIAETSGLMSLNQKIKDLIASSGSITVELYKPHAKMGKTFQPAAFDAMAAKKFRSARALEQPASGYTYMRTPTKSHVTKVKCAGIQLCFVSRSLMSYDEHERPRDTINPLDIAVKQIDEPFLEVDDPRRKQLYLSLLDKQFDVSLLTSHMHVRSNGDFVCRLGASAAYSAREQMSDFVTWVPDETSYVVFRGIGNRAIALNPPLEYSRGKCLRFFLLYDKKYDRQQYALKELQSGRYNPDVQELPASPSPHYDKEAYDKSGTIIDLGYDEVDEQREDVGPVVIDDSEDGRQFVRDMLSQQKYYMSGAIGAGDGLSPPITPLGLEFDSSVVPAGLRPDKLHDVSDASDAGSARASRAPSERSVTVNSDALIPGRASMLELVDSCTASTTTALGVAREVFDLLTAMGQHDVTKKTWQSVVSSHPGNVRAVLVEEGSDKWSDYLTGEEITNMAIANSKEVFDRVTNPPGPGLYVTGKELQIYTGSAIRSSVLEVADDPYSCVTTAIDGVAGSGKSYDIEHRAGMQDVILCETRESLRDIAKAMNKKEGWQGRAYTVDSFLMHRQIDSCDVLWLDEAYRLHAGKIYAVIKILRPSKCYAFGDTKQIAALPFIPGYDFIYNAFPFHSTQRKLVSWRCPADVVFALSQPLYYGAHVTTHNPIMRSVGGPVQYVPGTFASKPPHVALLVYTHAAADQLRKEGVRDVMTIGESQGKTFDDVIVFRDSELSKELYFSPFQTLVAITRHRRTCTYVTSNALRGDSSMFAELIKYVRSRSTEVALASHVYSGVKPVADASALRAEQKVAGPVDSLAEHHDSDPEGWDSVGREDI